MTDEGKEFRNKEFKKVLDENSITLYHAHTKIKASIVERANRTIRLYLMKYLEERGGTRVWVDKLQIIAHIYNHKHHRTIGMRPVECVPSREKEVLRKKYAEKNEKQCEKVKFKLFDPVRLAFDQKIFQKESSEHGGSWTNEIFYIIRIHKNSHPCTYNLMNSQCVNLIGKIYDSEIINAKYETLFIIDRIVSREDPEKWQVLLKGFPATFKIEIHMDDVHEIKY